MMLTSKFSLMDVIVRLGEALVHYTVSRETKDIYQARLVRYEGCPTEEPPRDLILVKGYRRWTGSVDRPELLNEMGQVIDSLRSHQSPRENLPL